MVFSARNMLKFFFLQFFNLGTKFPAPALKPLHGRVIAFRWPRRPAEYNPGDTTDFIIILCYV